MLRLWLKAAAVLWLGHGYVRVAGSLYTEEDPLVILSSGSLKSSVTNSSSAWLLQFYSSWCGHCVQYSSTWKVLAEDVKGTRSAVAAFRSAPKPSFHWSPRSPSHTFNDSTVAPTRLNIWSESQLTAVRNLNTAL